MWERYGAHDIGLKGDSETAGMASEQFKSGSQIVSEFLDSLQGNNAVDARTLAAIRDLFEAGRLTKTRLLNALEALRVDAIAEGNLVAPDEDTSSDD